jgi:3',5'-cyclic AMP phosphodiesterase CpdA
MVFEAFDPSNVAGDRKSVNDGPTAEKSVALAHLSDPHISCMTDITARDLVTKRLFGFLRWKLHRGAEHGDRVLAALQTDLAQTQPDQIAVTGDLTHLSLPSEFKKARQWLQSLGSASRVTVIPGNHDAYVNLIWHQSMAYWTEYMISDSPPEDISKIKAPANIFPSLRTRNGIAVIGVCTARPSAPHLAVGSIGATQRRKLETILAQTARKQLYRVILIHHPPTSGTVSWRKRLTDAAALRSLLEQYGAELILHGHAHRTLWRSLPTPAGKVPVVGAPSISAIGRTPERRARYYLYRIKRLDGRWDVKLEVRIYSPEKNRFIREKQQPLANE